MIADRMQKPGTSMCISQEQGKNIKESQYSLLTTNINWITPNLHEMKKINCNKTIYFKYDDYWPW